MVGFSSHIKILRRDVINYFPGLSFLKSLWSSAKEKLVSKKKKGKESFQKGGGDVITYKWVGNMPVEVNMSRSLLRSSPFSCKSDRRRNTPMGSTNEPPSQKAF